MTLEQQTLWNRAEDERKGGWHINANATLRLLVNLLCAKSQLTSETPQEKDVVRSVEPSQPRGRSYGSSSARFTGKS